jgi:hypothetical protein
VQHWKQHKQLCGVSVLSDEYPAQTIADLQKAFPELHVIDGSHEKFSSIPAWVNKLEADPSQILVILRRRGAANVSHSEGVFRTFGLGVVDPVNQMSATSALSISSTMLVFHRDNYYHLAKHSFDVMCAFLRRRIQPLTDSMEKECQICFEKLPAEFIHRVACTTCTFSVCNNCVAAIVKTNGSQGYVCPGCRAEIPIGLYESKCAQ